MVVLEDSSLVWVRLLKLLCIVSFKYKNYIECMFNYEEIE